LERNNEPIIFVPDRYYDKRGYFAETWNKSRCEDLGVFVDFVQDNCSISYNTGTLRGLHVQIPPKSQAKLVRCGKGSLFDVFVDIRQGSPNYGRWMGEVLSEENGKQIFIPEGFLHGFITLETDTEINYKCTSHYSPEHERTIRFDDPDIAVEWPVEIDLKLISEKDSKAMALKDFNNPFRLKT